MDKKRLSPVSREIVRIVKQLGGQRKFANATGFSQSLVSKIVTGRQEASPELIDAIARLNEVDGQKLLSLAASQARQSRDECLVPVSTSLLAGPLADEPEQLTNQTISVPPAVYRRSLYAVPAAFCMPACCDPKESLLNSDIVVIESEVDSFLAYPLRVAERLCVWKSNIFNSISVKRCSVAPEARGCGYRMTAKAYPEDQANSPKRKELQTKRLRPIVVDDFDAPDARAKAEAIASGIGGSEQTTGEAKVPQEDIVGVVILVIRNV